MLFFLMACGSWVGNWEGACENPATGETREFVIDVDADKRGEVEGSAFMTINDKNGNTTIINCAVTGPSNRSGVDFEFNCDNGEAFTIVTERQGADLLGYCDNAKSIELRLQQD